MTIKNYTQLKTDIAAAIPDAGASQITPADLRGQMINIVDSVENNTFTKSSDNLLGISNRDFLSNTLVGGWSDFYLPSPYDAPDFASLSQKVKDQMTPAMRTIWDALTPTQRKGQTHPSVLVFDKPWNGYSYWMAFTPYPNAESAFENPCICASINGLNWIVPDGVVNPIIPPAVSPGYNADTHLIHDPVADILIMIYRERNNGANALNKVICLTSIDGVTWSAPTTILSGATGTLDFASPSIWWDPVINKYVMFAHNLDLTNWPIMRYESASLLSGWTQTGQVTMPSIAGRKWWHSYWKRTPSGEIIGIVADNNGNQGAAGDLYLSTSYDSGVSAGCKKLVGYRRCFGATAVNYRSTFWMSGIGDCSLNLIAASISGGLSRGVAKSNVKSKRDIENDLLSMGLTVGKSTKNKVLVADDFVRADSNGLGSDYTGKPWTQIDAGNPIGILGNAAYGFTAGNCRAIIDCGVSNYDMLIAVRAIVNEVDLIFGYIDASNYFRLNIRSTSSGEATLNKVVGGVNTVLSAGFGNLPTSDRIIRIRRASPILEVYSDGELIHSVSDTQLPSGTKVGIRSNGGQTSFIDAVVVLPI